MSAPARPESIAALARLLEALRTRGVVTDEELAARQASTDSASPETGARMVARAWLDPEYRALLLRDGKAAAEAMGVSMAGAPPLGVLEDTPARHHLVVCTLCSCYPIALLGPSPTWYKSEGYRSQVVRDPRAVLRQFGYDVPAGVEITVWDASAESRYMVLPARPAGTDDLDEAALATLVTRDGLIGVAAV